MIAILRLFASTVVAAALVAAVASPAAADDYGDAPDGVSASYPADLTVRASFPSRARSGGPRHGAAGPHLAGAPSSERDSRQVDRDADDGATLRPRSCATSTLLVAIDARRLPPAAKTVYVNAWFDWNADGDWADGARGRCGPEWGVQNYEVPRVAFGAGGILNVPIRFRGGRIPPEFWWRGQVQAERRAEHTGGAASARYRGGETEDRLFHARHSDDDQPPPGVPPPLYRCFGAGDVYEHDARGIMGLTIFAVVPTNYPPAAAKRITNVRLSLRGDVQAVGPPKGSVNHGVLSAYTNTGRRHFRLPVFQRLAVVVRFDVTIRDKKFPRRVDCPFTISHADRYPPRLARQSHAGPAQPPPVQGPLRCTISRTFVVDGSRVPSNGFANFGISVSLRIGTTTGEVTLTDETTHRRPAADYFGPSFPWEEMHRPRPDTSEPGRTILDLFVNVRDFAEGAPAQRRGTWRFTLAYTPPPGPQGCDAREVR